MEGVDDAAKEILVNTKNTKAFASKAQSDDVDDDVVAEMKQSGYDDRPPWWLAFWRFKSKIDILIDDP